MKKYQKFLEQLSQLGNLDKDPDGKMGISLPSYILEYQFERGRGRKFYGKPLFDGFPLITENPNRLILGLLSDINRLPVREFEGFNRTISDLTRSQRVVSSLKLGKTIELPFLKKPGDIRVPTCKIIEPGIKDINEYGSLNLGITLYRYEVISQLPKCLDTITVFYCLLCSLCDYIPNKITFTLVHPFCEDKHLCDLDSFLQRTNMYKAMEIKSGALSFFAVNESDIKFSMLK